MQKLFIVLTLLISYYTGFTQQMGYHPVFIDQCSGERLFDLITVFNADRTYFSDNSKNDTIPIPKPGIYFTSVFLSEYQPNKIEIVQNEILHDTLHNEKLKCVTYLTEPPFSEYLYCEKKAESKVIDRYYNGKIWHEGTFKKGQPIDTVKTYYSTGEIQEISYQKKKKWILKKFYLNGNVMTIRGNLNGQYKEEEYYENGQLKTKTDRKGTFSYSEDGVLIENQKP